jgi:hypothetical protein
MNIGRITARKLEIRPLDAYFLPANGGGRFLMSIGRIGARGEPVRPPAAYPSGSLMHISAGGVHP